MGILDKIKSKLKKLRKPKKTQIRIKVKKEVGELKPQKETYQLKTPAVEEAKFYTGPEIQIIRKAPLLWELPAGYGRDKIIAQVRDPWWIHAYWELTPSTLNKLSQELGSAFHGARKVIRVYDISYITFDGTNAHRFFDIEIGDANNWYIDTQAPGRSWCIDLGIRLSDERFIKIARSNTITTPLAGPSWLTDEEWMIPEELFARMYGMSIGMGSSPVGIKKLMPEGLRQEFASGLLASPGFSPVKKAQPRGFWLVVNTELIVYGATEPDAKVTVQGKPIVLRPDGTFTLRFALPDGKQVIPVRAVSKDGIDERTITPWVSKETR